MSSATDFRALEPQMNRLASAILAFAVVTAPGLTAVPTVAQTKMDCTRLYKDFWEKLDREVRQDFRRAASRREPFGASRLRCVSGW